MSASGAQPGEPDGREEALVADWTELMRCGESTGAAATAEDDGADVDSLLDFCSQPEPGQRAGLLALVNSNDITYERLPMLEVVFDRLERMLTTSLRNFTSENADLSLESITAQRFGDYMNVMPQPAMIAVFKAVEWDNYGLLAIDSPMIYAIVDVLLGGRRGSPPVRIEGRPYTTIEGALVQRLVQLVLADLTQAFAPVAPVEFRFERMETNPRFAAIARPGNACVCFRLRADLQDRGGCLEFLIPYATLEPARELLLQMFMGEKFGRDAIWESHLSGAIMAAGIELAAVLDERVLPLRTLLELEIGSTLRLESEPDATVTLRAGSVPMLRGRIGRKGEQVAVRVQERLLPDLADDA